MFGNNEIKLSTFVKIISKFNLKPDDVAKSPYIEYVEDKKMMQMYDATIKNFKVKFQETHSEDEVEVIITGIFVTKLRPEYKGQKDTSFFSGNLEDKADFKKKATVKL